MQYFLCVKILSENRSIVPVSTSFSGEKRPFEYPLYKETSNGMIIKGYVRETNVQLQKLRYLAQTIYNLKSWMIHNGLQGFKIGQNYIYPRYNALVSAK